MLQWLKTWTVKTHWHRIYIQEYRVDHLISRRLSAIRAHSLGVNRCGPLLILANPNPHSQMGHLMPPPVHRANCQNKKVLLMKVQIKMLCCGKKAIHKRWWCLQQISDRKDDALLRRLLTFNQCNNAGSVMWKSFNAWLWRICIVAQV